MTRANDIATMIKDGRFIDYNRIPALVVEEYPTITGGIDSATLSDAYDINRIEVHLNGVLLKKTTEYTLQDSAIILQGSEVFADSDVLAITVFKPDANSVNLALDTINVNISTSDGKLLKYDSATSKIISTSLVEDGNGNVGIGTSSPNAALTAVTDTDSTAIFSVGVEQSGGGFRYLNILSPSDRDDNDAAFRFVTANSYAFRVDATDRLTIDASGNVGIGTVSPAQILHLEDSDVNTRLLVENTNSVSPKQASVDLKTTVREHRIIGASDGKFRIYDQTGASSRFTIDTSGNVGIGTESPAYKLDVVDSIDGVHVSRVNNTSTGSSSQSFLQLVAGGRYVNFRTNYAGQYFQISGSNITSYYQDFDTHFFRNSSGTQHMALTNVGDLLVGKTSTSTTADGFMVNSSGQAYAVTPSNFDAGVFYRKTTNSGFGVILTKSDVGGTNTLVGAGYANGTFGTISDINKKKNIEDARGYLEDLMQIRVVKYNWNTDEDSAPKELGWIAQEVEQVFPGMVEEMEGSKLLKKEVFVPMLLKAIQEQQTQIEAQQTQIEAQQTQIEALEAKVAALESGGA